MPHVHLIEGPVGSGKSTYASALAGQHGGIHIALDAWFVALFSPDRPPGAFSPSWYSERKERLLQLIWRHARQVLAAGKDVVLELGLIQRQPRREFCEQVRRDGHELVIHIVDAPIEVRRERVRRRNDEKGATFSMVVPDAVFEMASALWEAPDEIERELFEVRSVDA